MAVDNLITRTDWDIWFKRESSASLYLSKYLIEAGFLPPTQREKTWTVCHVGNIKPCLTMHNDVTDYLVDSICGRDKPVFEGVQARISYLPFERHTFNKITQKFNVHPTITRTIGREIAYFSIHNHGSWGMKYFKISESLYKTVSTKRLIPVFEQRAQLEPHHYCMMILLSPQHSCQNQA
jgi:hypothetical protein